MKLEEPKSVEEKDSKLYNFNFEKFDNQLGEAIQIIYPEDAADCHAYIMLAVKKNETYPMGVILFKSPESSIEKEALKAHIRKFMESLDE